MATVGGTGKGPDLSPSFHAAATTEPVVFQPEFYLQALPRPTSPSSLSAREWDSLAREKNPELFFVALEHFAGRELNRNRPETAALAYQTIVAAAAALPEQKKRAQERWNAMQGVGAAGARVEFLLRDLAKQSTDPAMLAAMGMAGFAYKATRLVGLNALAASPTARAWLSPGARGFAASLGGFAGEVPAFALSARLGHEALGRSPDWSLRALGRDLSSSALVLGGLKLGGAASGMLERRLLARLPSAFPSVSTPFQQAGMLGGVFLGHGLEQKAGLREALDGATTFADSLVTLLQFNIAGRLAPSLLKRDLARWELAVSAQNAAWKPPLSHPPWPSLFQGEGVPWAWSSVAPGQGKLSPQLVFSSSHDEGGKPSPPPSSRVESARSASSKPPIDHGVILRDALAWGSRQSRSSEDVTRMVSFVDKIRVEMWNVLNLCVDKPLARALGQGKKVYVRVQAVDGSLDHYEIELSAHPTPREVHPNYVEFVLDSNQGQLRLRDLPSQAAEIHRLQAAGFEPGRSFLGYYRSILDFESPALQSAHLVAAMPANVRALVLQQATHYLRPVIPEAPVLPKFVRAPEPEPQPTPLVSYFPYIAEVARQEVEDFANNAGIRGRNRTRLHGLVQKLLVGLHARESVEPKMIRYPYLQARLKPDPEIPSKRIIEILTPKEALPRPPLANEVIFNIVRHPSSMGEGFAHLHHVYLRIDSKGQPIEADLRFQEDLGIRFNLKVRLDALSLETFDEGAAQEWLRENGYLKE